MKQSIRRLAVASAFGVLALPALAGAQRPEPREVPRADATRIINMRRELDLTARQLTQLDSIERVTVAERRANAERMRERMGERMGARRDSMRPRNDSLGRTQMRDSMRARMEAMRPEMERLRRTDSTRREAAERVLNDAQRQRLREIQAEERGRQRGLREARAGRGGQGMRGQRGGAGMRGRAGMQPRVGRPQGAPVRARVRPVRPE